MFAKRALKATLDGFEIGATGNGRLQFVIYAEGRRVTLGMTAEEARFIAYGLGHWADVSDGLSPPTPDFIKPMQ